MYKYLVVLYDGVDPISPPVAILLVDEVKTRLEALKEIIEGSYTNLHGSTEFDQEFLRYLLSNPEGIPDMIIEGFIKFVKL